MSHKFHHAVQYECRCQGELGGIIAFRRLASGHVACNKITCNDVTGWFTQSRWPDLRSALDHVVVPRGWEVRRELETLPEMHALRQGLSNAHVLLRGLGLNTKH